MIKNIILTFVFLTFLSLSIATDTNSTKLVVNSKKLYVNAGQNSSKDNHVEVKKNKLSPAMIAAFAKYIEMIELFKSNKNFIKQFQEEVIKYLEKNKLVRQNMTEVILEEMRKKIKRSINPPREKEDNSNEKDDSDF
ncbi:Hypothetical protein SRAE_1000103500 [Strongyloides ratti]|uniref:Uncharacterized protein n=1 Tax=Strongyloides ratti TaxID=34506 RepID=A0A090KZ36_STRRB|nr:Hypothetical protein SRAE_1000103500 [Strongyloides ratti]CEF62765.1 Hypothetical protein SRAE_1000103500 [Strongyloides ratti]